MRLELTLKELLKKHFRENYENENGESKNVVIETFGKRVARNRG